MKTKLFIFLIVITSIAKQTQAQIITTVAGNGTQGYSGDGGQATAAELNWPAGIIIDSLGNIFFAEQSNNRVRKISTTGIITTIAGNGTSGYTGDGGLAIAAELKVPTELVFDKYGNLYVSDQGNDCVRKINTNGIISTIAGTGVGGYSGDGGQATAAELSNTGGLLFDKQGNLYIGDAANYRVRKVDTLGIITTFAGTGISGNTGDGGQATLAELSGAVNFYIDGYGNFFISDQNNNNIRKINTAGIISTIAGTGAVGFSGDGGQATACMFDVPESIKKDLSGNLYIADFSNNRIREINTSGIITTIVGSGTGGYSGDGGMATAAELYNPYGIAFDAQGNLYIADYANNRIRKVTNVGQAAGIEQIANNKEQVNIYPNPATNSLQVSFSGNSESSTLVMTDMLGNTIKQTTFNTQRTTLNIADVSAGVYFITLTSGTTISTQKVIVR